MCVWRSVCFSTNFEKFSRTFYNSIWIFARVIGTCLLRLDKNRYLSPAYCYFIQIFGFRTAEITSYIFGNLLSVNFTLFNFNLFVFICFHLLLLLFLTQCSFVFSYGIPKSKNKTKIAAAASDSNAVSEVTNNGNKKYWMKIITHKHKSKYYTN